MKKITHTLVLIISILFCFTPGILFASTDHCPDLSHSKNIDGWSVLLGDVTGHDAFVQVSIATTTVVGCTYNDGHLILGKNYPTATGIKPVDPSIWDGKVCSQSPTTCIYTING